MNFWKDRPLGTPEIEQLPLPPRLINYHLPLIDTDRTNRFEAYMKTHHQEHLFHKLLSNIRFIDHEETFQTMSALVGHIPAFTQAGQYDVLIDDWDKSGWYIASGTALPTQPRQFLPIFVGYDENEIQIPPDNSARYVYIDDASYSGSQLSINLKEFIKRNAIAPANIMVLLVGITTTAYRRIRQESGVADIRAAYRIPVVTEMFSPQEQEV
jgi:hypothetical protein